MLLNLQVYFNIWCSWTVLTAGFKTSTLNSFIFTQFFYSGVWNSFLFELQCSTEIPQSGKVQLRRTFCFFCGFLRIFLLLPLPHGAEPRVSHFSCCWREHLGFVRATGYERGFFFFYFCWSSLESEHFPRKAPKWEWKHDRFSPNVRPRMVKMSKKLNLL